MKGYGIIIISHSEWFRKILSHKYLHLTEGIINKNQGKILKTEEWGFRNLSYEIKKNKKGFYFHFKLEGIGKTIEELEKTENIDDVVLRFLTIRVKKNDLETNYFEKFEKKEDKKILEKNEKK